MELLHTLRNTGRISKSARGVIESSNNCKDRSENGLGHVAMESVPDSFLQEFLRAVILFTDCDTDTC